MKKKIFISLSLLCITTILFTDSCKKEEQETMPAPKKIALKVDFKQYSAPDYLCSAPIFNTANVLINDPALVEFDFAAQEGKDKNAIMVLVEWQKKDGTYASFGNVNSRIKIEGEKLFVEVPSTGKYRINFDYSTRCQKCMPLTGYGNVPLHELWRKDLTSEPIGTASADTIQLNLVSNKSAKLCGQ